MPGAVPVVRTRNAMQRNAISYSPCRGIAYPERGHCERCGDRGVHTQRNATHFHPVRASVPRTAPLRVRGMQRNAIYFPTALAAEADTLTAVPSQPVSVQD